MGISQTCPCSSRATENPDPTSRNNKENSNRDLVDKLLLGKMTLNNLLYYYDYDKTKVCLLKTKDLLDFFNSKNLLRLPAKKEINYYYDKISLTNFLEFNETTFLIMEYTQKTFEKSSKEINIMEKNFNTLNYVVDDLVFSNIDKKDRIKTSKNLYDLLVNDLKCKTKRNYIFTGLVKEIKDNQLVFKMIYKKNIRLDLDVVYEIFIFDGKITEDSIKYILTEDRFKNKLLKSIVSYSAEILSQKPFFKNLKTSSRKKALKALKGSIGNADAQKCYFFIFEENIQQTLDYDYLVISLDSNLNSNETMLQDIARKLNDYQEEYKLSCVFSDDKKIFLVLETANADQDSNLLLNNISDYKIA